MSGETPLQASLQRGLQQGADLSQELARLGDYPIETVVDAQAVCDALRDPAGAASLHPLASLFQDAATEDAFTVFAEQGLPVLREIFDRRVEAPGDDAEDLLFLLKIFALYKDEEGLRRMQTAVKRNLDPESFVWAVIFESLEEEHPHQKLVLNALRDPLPQGFAAVTYLDFANRLALDGELDQHPFDNAAGLAMLEHWLRSEDPEEYSYAQSATAALPFITNPQRNQLMSLAMEHPDDTVQLEAAWASAKLGSEAGVKSLARYCLIPTHSVQACAYLDELDKGDLIPEEAREPDFQAMSEMCAWLADPQEYGDAPDVIELYDSREAYWPPTDDVRPLWLFKYTYEGDEGEENEVGVGMVGSITFALFGESHADLSPDEVYALHCCWELEVNDDPRAPQQRSIAEGRQILGEYWDHA